MIALLNVVHKIVPFLRIGIPGNNTLIAHGLQKQTEVGIG